MTGSSQSQPISDGLRPTTESAEPAAAIAFLHEAATYFERRPTNGEDSAHWSNVYNAKNCRAIAEMIAGASWQEVTSLPPLGVPVLLWGPGGVVFEGAWANSLAEDDEPTDWPNCTGEPSWFNSAGEDVGDWITHWQPMPSPPLSAQDTTEPLASPGRTKE